MVLWSLASTWQFALLPPHCCLCGLPSDALRDLCLTCIEDLYPPPHPCPRCGEAVASDATAWPCGRCQRRPPLWDALCARCPWIPPADELVLRLKFGRRTECARVMAELMAARPPAFLDPDAWLVPIPLHWRRRWYRGFNQSALLTAHLARLTGQPQLPGGLRRQRATRAQSSLSAQRRRHALHGAFTAKAGSLPRHLVLVDDVVTTGATLSAAAKVCRAAGAEQVTAWVFARSDRRSGSRPISSR